jgi:prephenate dehydratase
LQANKYKTIELTAGNTSTAPTGTAGLQVAFQGERGAFSEKAIKRYFDDQAIPVPCASFQAVFDAVLEGRVQYGALPLENSLSGSIHENYDLIIHYPDLKIVGEKKIRIVHNLIVVPGTSFEDIKRVYSHPQGFAQCAKFLDKYPAWERLPYYDTAGSVAMIATKGNKENAAIASTEAAQAYKMQILKESIETNAHNYTRFVILTREENVQVTKPNKASLVFSVSDKPGSLYICLKILSEKTVNMTKLESRPIHGKPWEYMFYVDVEIPDSEALFHEAIEQLQKETENLKILGLYKS